MASYFKLVATYPHMVLLCVLVFVAICGTIVFTTQSFPDFSDPLKGFESRGTAIKGRTLALQNIRKENLTSVLIPLPVANDSPPATIRRKRATPSCTAEFDMGYLGAVVFASNSGGNLFSASSMKSICRIDEGIRTFMSDDVKACPSYSIGHVVASMRGKDCPELADEDILAVKNVLITCAPFYFSSTLGPFGCGNETCPDECTLGSYVYIILHFLADEKFLDPSTNSTNLEYSTMLVRLYQESKEIHTFYMAAILDKDLLDGDTVVVGIGFRNRFEIFTNYLREDVVYFGLGMGLILVIMCIYMKSISITIATVFLIIFAALFAYFVYFTIFRLTFFPFLNICAIVVLIGVGADDVFVFFDIWKQLQDDGVLEYTKLVSGTFGHASFSILVTSLTTAMSFFANVVSDITAVKCFGIFAGLCILANLLFLVTWVPAVVVISDKCWKYFSRKCCSRDSCATLDVFKSDIVVSFINFPRQIVTKWIPRIVKKLWIMWLIVLGALGIGGFIVILYKPGLRPPSAGNFRLFHPNHLTEKYVNEYADMFRYMKQPSAGMVLTNIWGVDPVDNGNFYDPDSLGTVLYDEHVNFVSAEFEDSLSTLCENWKTMALYNRNDEEVCLWTKIKQLMKNCAIISSLDCCDRSAHYANHTHYGVCLQELMTSSLQQTGNESLINGAFLTDSSNRIRAASLSIPTSQEWSFSYDLMDIFYKNVSAFYSGLMLAAPPSVKDGWFGSIGQFSFYDLQRSLSSGIYSTAGISMGVSFVLMLIATQNILISVYAIVAILLAIGVTVGILVLNGWELNILESIVITLAVGLSIDFTIHYGVAYTQSSSHLRQERTDESFKRVGFPVALAALTTFLAGVSLMPATTLAYYQLGLFMVIVMTISWLYGTFFFQAMCYGMGPNGSFCQIPIPWSKRKRTGHKISDANETGAVTPNGISLITGSNVDKHKMVEGVDNPVANHERTSSDNPRTANS